MSTFTFVHLCGEALLALLVLLDELSLISSCHYAYFCVVYLSTLAAFLHSLLLAGCWILDLFGEAGVTILWFFELFLVVLKPGVEARFELSF